MNRYNKIVLTTFTSNNNTEKLLSSLAKKFQSPVVNNYLKNNFASIVRNFAKRYEIEMLNSDPISLVSPAEQVDLLNSQFLNETTVSIVQLIGEDTPERYSLSDGYIASRSDYTKSPNDMLKSWDRNSAAMYTLREDQQGDDHYNGYYKMVDCDRTGGKPSYTHTCNEKPAHIDFCDQSDLNTSHADATFKADWGFNLLNDKIMYGGGFGDKRNDEQLLSKRTFRADKPHGPGRRENGVPFYEKALYRRNYDRDIWENLRSNERDCIIAKHDMESLYERVDQRIKYQTQCLHKGPGPYSIPHKYLCNY